MTDDPKSTAAEALRKALAVKKAAAKGGGGGFKPAQHAEKSVERQNAALNKPAFRRASKRG